MAILQFEPMKSAVDIAFWSELSDLKLKVWRLSEEKVNMQVPGLLHNFNTEKSFKELERGEALTQVGMRIWHNIMSGVAEQHPSVLNLFLLLSYANLKTFVYWSWFGFPAVKPPEPFTVSTTSSLQETAEDAELSQISKACDSWRQPDQNQHVSSASASSMPQLPFWLLAKSVDSDGHWRAEPLTKWAEMKQSGHTLWLCMADPSNNPHHPGWPLRNMLLLAAKQWQVTELHVLCVRDHRGKLDAKRSLFLHVNLPIIPEGWEPTGVVGWEPNNNGKLAPRHVDLGPSMDPRRLASSAVSLNVSLMRWRAAPSLGIDQLQSKKMLLLGAGTLGCAVARTLLGWGVRHITLVDNSHVAFSNPVRQSLYEFEDCLHGGTPKAEAAAQKLRQIFPGAISQGVSLTIPMPGHNIAPSEHGKVQAQAERLAELVEEHDVVYELLDTREARWLPTLLAAAAGKLVINAALGFDSYLVMRHGLPLQDNAASEQGTSSSDKKAESRRHRLGCYFCNDVVAPLNSTVDRTLEQQCTVARPGLASIAGAIAVELMACTLQHPDGVHAPAAQPGQRVDHAALPLGAVPHMVRGQLSGFSQMCLEGQAFNQCTACSPTVVEQYRQHGWTFLLQALQEPKSLEDLTGLTKLHAEATRMQSEAATAAAPSKTDQHNDDNDSIPDIDDEWTMT